MENLTYRNIDILDHREMQVDYQGCLAINAGDNNLVRNVRFENIRIENFRQGQLVNLRIFITRSIARLRAGALRMCFLKILPIMAIMPSSHILLAMTRNGW